MFFFFSRHRFFLPLLFLITFVFFSFLCLCRDDALNKRGAFLSDLRADIAAEEAMNNSLSKKIARLSASERLEAFAAEIGMVRPGDEDYEYIAVDF